MAELLTASVMLRYRDKPSAHELRMSAEAERDTLRAQVEVIRSALNEAKYRIEQGRVWAGTKWQLTGLHPLGQQKALDVIDEALQAKP